MKTSIAWASFSMTLSDKEYYYNAEVKADINCRFPVPTNLDSQVLGQLLQGYALVALQDYNNKLLESKLEENSDDQDSE